VSRRASFAWGENSGNCQLGPKDRKTKKSRDQSLTRKPVKRRRPTASEEYGGWKGDLVILKRCSVDWKRREVGSNVVREECGFRIRRLG